MTQNLPFELAQEFGVVPTQGQSDESGALIVATAPHMTVATLSAARQRLGKPLRTQAVSADRFAQLLTLAYSGTSESSHRARNAHNAINTDTAAADSIAKSTSDQIADRDLLAIAADDEAPAVRLLADLLRDALAMSASDIHIDATEQGARVRFRIDGVLRDVRELDRSMHAALTARCKVMATLDIAERRLPQDGRLQVTIAGRKVDVRVATLPTQYGERAVLRLLDTAAARLDLTSIGMPEAVQSALRDAVRMPNGLVLVTGPTGSGKTTTLYAAVSELDRQSTNVVSVEDPIEYALDRVAQTQVNPRIDLTFARALRSILRHDPDVIIVGEIRDRETAEIAIQASLTGHLVLASLHTNSAGAAVTRLVDMGVEPYLLASSLRGVLAQRLVRKLCSHCRETRAASATERESLARYGINGVDLLSQSKGCEHCNGTGYRGRFGLYRWLPCNPAMSQQIHARASDDALEAIASREGFDSMAANAAAHLQRGDTSLAEVLRVVTG
jgi:general secretion pathway protein E